MLGPRLRECSCIAPVGAHKSAVGDRLERCCGSMKHEAHGVSSNCGTHPTHAIERCRISTSMPEVAEAHDTPTGNWCQIRPKRLDISARIRVELWNRSVEGPGPANRCANSWRSQAPWLLRQIYRILLSEQCFGHDFVGRCMGEGRSLHRAPSRDCTVS